MVDPVVVVVTGIVVAGEVVPVVEGDGGAVLFATGVEDVVVVFDATVVPGDFAVREVVGGDE